MQVTNARYMMGACAAALLAIAPCGAALAQDQGGATGMETVVVTASRVTLAGYDQPTPVTVVGLEQIQQAAKVDIGDTIRELPSVSGGAPQNGTSSQVISGAPAGQSNLSLRGLGNLRTLILFDGQRVVQSNITGGVDLNTFPTSLVQRVDVVTGGASAAWGSDAVAGVVNLILDKNFVGFRANISASDNNNDTYRTVKMEGSWGASLLGDRLHVILSGAYVTAPDTAYMTQATWYKKTQIVPNPVAGGAPTYIHVDNVGMSQATPGGLIVSNPAGTTPGSANVLKNIAFVGPDANPIHINPGNVAGAVAWGGDLTYANSMTPIVQLASPYRTSTLFAHFNYKLTDSISASLQLNYGKSWEQNTGQASFLLGTQVITADNPYIPASIRSVMTANGIPSFTMGTLNTNNCDILHLSVSCAKASLGIPVNDNNRQLMRGVFTLQGSIGDDWYWNAYYQHGIVRVGLRVLNESLKAQMSQAIDAVTVTSVNRGTSGLPLGSIVCRSSLAAPGNGCQPLNIFGEGVASADAINWINSHPNNNYEDITLNQDVLAGMMQGVLPWQLPAGPVAVAFGAEYRKEGGRTVADPRANAALWYGGNFADFAGQYNVMEGFLEVDAPLLKNTVVQSLDFTAAGRMTSYSTSGLVETWKLGLTSQVIEDFKLRTTWSTDIRAPNLSELFSSHQINTGSQVDLNSPTCTAPIGANGFPTSTAGCGSSFILNDRGGNTALQPEVAQTITGGVVLTPSFIEGLMVSLDWYNISIKKAITTLTGNPTQCAAGVQAYCDLLVFNGPVYSNGKPALGTVRGVPVNANFERVSGLDIQLDYPMNLFDGKLLWHAVANYNDEHTTVNAGVTCDSAGMAGNNAACSGTPKFAGIGSVTYAEGPISLTAQTRFTGPWVLNNAWVDGVDIDNNHLDWKFFLDLRASYKWTNNIQLYAAIDNATNAPPQVVPPMYTGSSYQAIGARSDTLGRVGRIGVRLSY